MSAPTVSEIMEEMGKNCNKSNVIQSQIDEIKVGNKITQRTKIVPQELCNESKQLLLKISLTVKFEYYKTLPLLLTHKIEVQQQALAVLRQTYPMQMARQGFFPQSSHRLFLKTNLWIQVEFFKHYKVKLFQYQIYFQNPTIKKKLDVKRSYKIS